MSQTTAAQYRVRFTDRREAGTLLARELASYADCADVIVLGIPRGGVPVAAEVAAALSAPLDLIVVRKLGFPDQPEVAMGAIGEDGSRIVDPRVVDQRLVSAAALAEVEKRERIELCRRIKRFRRGGAAPSLTGKIAILVDDGIATGSTALAACQIAKARGARHVVLAVPVAPMDWTKRLGQDADEFVAVHTPTTFQAVGQHYRDFDQTSDDEVVACLEHCSIE